MGPIRSKTFMYWFPNIRIIYLMKSVLNYNCWILSFLLFVYQLFSVYDSCMKQLPPGMSTSTNKAVNRVLNVRLNVARCYLKIYLPLQ